MTITEKLIPLLNKCDFVYNGNVFSKEDIIKDYWGFLSNSISDEKTVNITLHTGSVLFDITAIFFASFLAIFSNDVDKDEVVRSLPINSLVLFEDSQGKTERYRFAGIKTDYVPYLKKKDEFAILEQENPKTNSSGSRTILRKGWSKIRPYFGASTSLDGKGIKTIANNATLFYETVLEMEKPNLINASSFIVCRKQYFDELFDKCSIFFEGNSVKLSELITASYFTETNEIKHSGNSASTEAVLKFAHNIEIARKDVINKENNYTCGAFVLGDDSIEGNVSQLPMLMNRKSLNYFLGSTRIDSVAIDDIVENCETKVSYFACTKERMNNYSGMPKIINNSTIRIYNQRENIKNGKNTAVVVSKPISLNEYVDIKKLIKSIKNSEYQSNEKNEFVVSCYSMLKLFTTIPFTINDMECVIGQFGLSIEMPSVKLNRLEKSIGNFPDYLRDNCNKAINCLKNLYKIYETNNEKENKLFDIIEYAGEKNIAVIVAKAYYSEVLKRCGIFELNNQCNITITTPNKFDKDIIYDLIITTSDFEQTKKFNQYRCINAREVYNLLFDHEHRFFVSKMKKIQRKDKIYNKQTIEKEDDEYIRENEWLEEYNSIDDELNSFVRNSTGYSDYRRYIGTESASSKFADTVATASFDSGETAFFTKMYKAYVFDESSGVVKEVKVEDLSDDDLVLFIRTNNSTRDIVDEILQELINDGVLSNEIKDNYFKSKVWKTRLKEYQDSHNFTPRELASDLKKSGINVMEQTIMYWLDEDSHTVGPRDPKSIEHIGFYVADEDLANNYMSYDAACAEVRRVRLSIIEQIGQTIVMRMSNKTPEKGSVHEQIFDKVAKLGELLRIERIVSTENQMPINMINRPLKIRE